MEAVVRTQLDYYALLEITPAASLAEVKVAFRRLAWRHHPDRNPDLGTTRKFQEINEARQVLSNPTLRYKYDAQRQTHFGNQGRKVHTPVRVCTRYSFRRRHIRAIVLTLISVLTIPCAWAVIFTTMITMRAHSYIPNLDSFSELIMGSLPDHSLSTAITHVYTDDAPEDNGTDWKTDIHDPWGGSAIISDHTGPLDLPALTFVRFLCTVSKTAARSFSKGNQLSCLIESIRNDSLGHSRDDLRHRAVTTSVRASLRGKCK